ncbi:MAG: hypothetical protein AB7O32_00495 [Vicinamibacterales bacterium]
MATPSTRQQILEALKTRLSAIDGRPPFETEIGRTIHLGEMPALGPDDPIEACVLLPEDDVVDFQRANLLIDWPITIGAVVKADLDEPWVLVERAIADIKRAVELADRRLGIALVRDQMRRGTTRVFERPEGSTVTGAGISYTVYYQEAWGNP